MYADAPARKPREIPILFNGDMVRAILDGRKTQTRRPAKERRPPLGQQARTCVCRQIEPSDRPCTVCIERFGASPFGRPGDLLWVRETWRVGNPEHKYHGADNSACFVYRAGGVAWNPIPVDVKYSRDEKWRPSIHMPKWATRLRIRVTDVWVERLHGLSEDDALAEGNTGHPVDGHAGYPIGYSPVDEFRGAWDSIYAKRGLRWNTNPWVWACKFERIQR